MWQMEPNVKKDHEDFKKWWKEEGYKYKPESDEEADWCNVVRYCSWKAFKAGKAWNPT